MRSQVTTEKYLANFGVSLKNALTFVISNLGDPKLLFSVCQELKLTTEDLAEIVRQDFPQITSLDVANYFSGNNLEPMVLDIPAVRDVQQKMSYPFFDYEKFYDYKGDITTDEAYKGGYDLIAVGDLNNDGSPEIVFGFLTWNDDWDTYPIEDQFAKKKVLVATKDPTTGNFEITHDYDGAIPQMYWTQTGRIDDFNNDGYNDLILTGTGPDQGMPRGEMPHLMLGSANGLVNASDQLPQKNMYTHQSVFADFNNDQKLDFFLINNSWINLETIVSLSRASGSIYPYSNEAILMLSTESGWEEKIIKNDYLNSSSVPNSFSTAIALDFNGDGNLDLALAGSNYGANAYRIMLLKGDGKGGFEEDSSFNPERAYGAGTVTGNMNTFDFNDDGSDELFLISTYSNSQPGYPLPWGGAVFQAFERNGKTGVWTEITSNYLPTEDISNGEPIFGSPNKSLEKGSEVWVKKTFFMDVDLDGDEDMILSTIPGVDEIQSGKVMPRLLVNEEGVFKPVKISKLGMSGFGSLVPHETDVGVSIVGASGVYGGWGLNIFEGSF